MRYSKEFKLECIRKYLNREPLPYPGGCKYRTFHRSVWHWTKIYQKLGEAGLDHKKPEVSLEEKISACIRVQNGETMNSIAQDIGRQEPQISRWYQVYSKEGIRGLQLLKKGRPPTMKKEKKNSKPQTLEEENKDLLKRIERLEIENEYLKKLDALVQARKDRQQKKK